MLARNNTSMTHNNFLPAAGHDFFLPLYDPIVSLMGFDRARQELLSQASVKPDHHLLDIGAGTGTFVVQLKQLFPDAQVTALDPDPKALSIAQNKISRAAVAVQLDRGFSYELPYGNHSFDRVFSSFMFHHLEEPEREKTLTEAQRVLKPGGSLHLLDFTANREPRGFLDRFIQSHATLRQNTDENLMQNLKRAGFSDCVKVGAGQMLFGLMPIGYYQALR